MLEEGHPRRNGKGAVGQMLRKLGYARGWGRPWLAEEENLVRKAYAEGGSLTRLGARLGREKWSIMWKAKDLGLCGTHPRPNGFRTEPDWEAWQVEMLRRDYGHVPSRELAVALGRKLRAMYIKA